jgi:hypothetical protein
MVDKPSDQMVCLILKWKKDIALYCTSSKKAISLLVSSRSLRPSRVVTLSKLPQSAASPFTQCKITSVFVNKDKPNFPKQIIKLETGVSFDSQVI